MPQGTVRAEIQGLEAEVNDRALDELRRWSLLALTAGAVAGVGVGWFAAGRVLRPVDRITGVARDIQATDLSRRIALDGPDDEMKELADTFDGMLGRLDEAFEGQRHFFQEASHELRNPLAVIRTNLDVALADEGASAPELRTAAELAARTAERMTHTVDDLLRYARNEQAVMAREDLDLGLLVAEVADEFRSPAATRSMHIETAVPSGPVVVSGDRAALRQAVANLLDNAVRLAPEGSTIQVGAGRGRPVELDRGRRRRSRHHRRGPTAGVPALLAGSLRRRAAGQRARPGHRRPDPGGPRGRRPSRLRAGAGLGLLAVDPAPPRRGRRRRGLSGPFDPFSG